jgi:hypothetical protein
MGPENRKRAVGRLVVVDEVVIDEAVVISKEERQHALLVPAGRMQMDDHSLRLRSMVRPAEASGPKTGP